MLKPLSEKPLAVDGFVTCDIETKPSGDVIDIDTCWRDISTNLLTHHTTTNWSDWFDWLCKTARYDQRFRTLYAHNGGGFDWLSLAEYLLSDGKSKRHTISAVCAGSKMVVLVVHIDKRFSIRFCDSLQLLRSSLDKLSNQFLGHGKTDLDSRLPHEVKKTDPKLYYEYLRKDTENLLLILEKSLDLIRNNIAKIDTWGLTIGSTALKVFRTVGMKDPINTPWQTELKSMLRDGYRGGRVECFKKGYFKRVYVYDINSLYPSVMVSTKVPTSDRVTKTTTFERGVLGVYEADILQRKTDIPAACISGGASCYRGRGVYYQPELDRLLEVDPDAKITIHNGYIFEDTDIVFDRYVERLYTLRIKHKDTPIDLLCKFLLNSLYGKFGQRPESEKLVAIKSWEDIQFLLGKHEGRFRPVDKNGEIGIITSESDVGHEHVGIAGTITSSARVALHRGLCTANNLVYCDTDSVHTTAPISDSFISDRLGCYKLEFVGEGVYAGKKLYGLRSKSETKIRSKGVSVGGRNGSSVGFDDLRRVSEGKSLRLTFQKPPSPREVFAGKKACKFLDRTRTIRST